MSYKEIIIKSEVCDICGKMSGGEVSIEGKVTVHPFIKTCFVCKTMLCNGCGKWDWHYDSDFFCPKCREVLKVKDFLKSSKKRYSELQDEKGKFLAKWQKQYDMFCKDRELQIRRLAG